jgi:hypothetical protein
MVNLLGYEDSDSDYLTQRQQIAAIPHWAQTQACEDLARS